MLDEEFPYKNITSVKTAVVSGFWAAFGVALACSSVPYFFGSMIEEKHLDKAVLTNGMTLLSLYMYVSVIVWAALSFSIKNRMKKRYNQGVASKKYNAKLLVDCIEKAFNTKSDETLIDNSEMEKMT